MRAVDLIRKKRDSGELSREEINFLVSGYTRGEIPDYQMAAWLMAVWIRGMNPLRARGPHRSDALFRGSPQSFRDSRQESGQTFHRGDWR